VSYFVTYRIWFRLPDPNPNPNPNPKHKTDHNPNPKSNNNVHCKFASVMWGEIRLIIFFYYASLLFILFPLLAKW